jgi:hypothetical protein
MAETAAVASAESLAGGYRVKFSRDVFLDLVRTSQPRRIYRVKNMHFFALDGFVMYTMECKDTDFGQRVLCAIEFSNQAWQKG